MNKTITCLAGLSACAGLFSGCSEITLLRTQELRAVEAHVDTLRVQLSDLQNKILEEQKAQGEIIRLMRADQEVRFSELDHTVSSINGNLTENQLRLSKIDEKTAEVQKQIQARLTADSTAENSRTTEIEKLFQIAMSDFNAGRYEIAINGFKDLVSRFPDAPRGQESAYWIAECHYAGKDNESAEKEYIGYLKNYPNGSKICVAIYKLGLCYEKQGKPKSKDMAWKKLIERCPDSPEAQMAKTTNH